MWFQPRSSSVSFRFVSRHVHVKLLAAGEYEPEEQGTRFSWPGLELGVELASHVKGMTLELDDLHSSSRFILAHEPEALLLKERNHLGIHLVPG